MKKRDRIKINSIAARSTVILEFGKRKIRRINVFSPRSHKD